ncbi:MAG: glycosyltransferase family 4 protein [Alphaproteobacteria bacterium]|nr:glycosyltransferase family 4 protein [Alphaproteobacteria bacterium]
MRPLKLCFVNLSALTFTVATPDHAPLGGSESSLCYLARQLARRGHNIALAANLPEGAAAIIENIRHFPLATIKDAGFFAAEKFDAIIICNAPAAAAPFKAMAPGARIIFWAHVLPDQPSMQVLKDETTRASIDATVFVSAWQRGEVERVFGPLLGAHVIGNGIAPAFENMFASADDLVHAKRNRAIYAATPYRGLSVLLRAMEGFDRPTGLDLFSSMRVYQSSDEDYAPLFRQAERIPAVTSHGAVTQTELARHMREAAFLFYPSIYAETFCIMAAEALAAGLKVVATELGALSDTTMGFADLVPVTSSDGDVLVTSFREAMRRAVDDFAQDPVIWAERRFAQAQQASRIFAWAGRAAEWEIMLGFA